MKTVTAREANQRFSALLAEIERGEEIVVTRRGRPVAVLSPYRPPAADAQREAAIRHMLDVMRRGLIRGPHLRRYARDEMYER